MSAEPIGTRITGVEHKVRDIKTAVDRIANAHSGNQNVSSITVQAGGVGIWICVTACLMMMVLSVVLLFAYLDVRDEQRVTGAHLQTIYMLVPGLREQVQKNLPQEGK